ncbi:MAG: aminoacyl-tRNA hydrolase [Sphingobacteriales bacterium JAD_PAG50586_3]|nr:MAG: aminoacyl-tRNA hydrolase [Sphingobacteriales bacterium JAD_PAG50586_3]
MKYLVACLGNIGSEYENTRHNVGFLVADELVKKAEGTFTLQRLAHTATIRVKNKTLVVIKPTTYMNLSGKAVRHYLTDEKIPLENLIVVTDDLALPFGTLRMKGSGSDGGHNGLKNIQEILQTAAYARLRFGVGNNFAKGRQVDYVLGQWDDEEKKTLTERVEKAADFVRAFCLEGLNNAMNKYNNK